jgi:hypothetical protein
MTTETGFHAPVVLADARERRARKQSPYPEVCDHLPEADEPFEQPNGRAARNACVSVVAFVFFLALAVVIGRALLKG